MRGIGFEFSARIAEGGSTVAIDHHDMAQHL
jgi:hypothetical protein